MASGAIAALAAGLVFALDGGALTVSLSLAALATAYVSTRLEIPALRWCVAGFGVAVAARLAWEPRVVGAALSPTPIFNWLLFGYGAPALAFGFAARLMRGGGEDTPVRVADALAVLFSAFLVFFEIRHATNGGDPFARGSGLVEQGLMAVSSFGFALVLTRLDAARANPVFRWASLAAGALGGAVAAISLLLRWNPFLDGVPVEGGTLINALLLSYALPAALAGDLALRRGACGRHGTGAAPAIVAAALAAAYLFLQLRVFFHGALIDAGEGFTLSELGLDAAAPLALAAILEATRAPIDRAGRLMTALFALSAAGRRRRAGVLRQPAAHQRADRRRRGDQRAARRLRAARRADGLARRDGSTPRRCGWRRSCGSSPMSAWRRVAVFQRRGDRRTERRHRTPRSTLIRRSGWRSAWRCSPTASRAFARGALRFGVLHRRDDAESVPLRSCPAWRGRCARSRSSASAWR